MKKLPLLLACLVLLLFPYNSLAIPLTINFESQTPGPKPNGYNGGVPGFSFSGHYNLSVSPLFGTGLYIRTSGQLGSAASMIIEFPFFTNEISLNIIDSNNAYMSHRWVHAFVPLIGYVASVDGSYDGLYTLTSSTLFDRIDITALGRSSYGGYPDLYVNNITIEAPAPSLDPSSVPEPATIFLLSAGLGVLALMKKKKGAPIWQRPHLITLHRCFFAENEEEEARGSERHPEHLEFQ